MRSGHRRTGGDEHPDRLLVDSGAWIALVSPRDQHHVEADRMLRLAVSRHIRLLTTNLVLAESHRFLLHRAGNRVAAAVLDRIDASPLVAIEFVILEHHRAARRWLARLADRHLTYTDAVSFAVMDAHRCRTAIAFDQDFVAAGFRLWQPAA